ncbi:deoxyribose-phosphate aldolase [Thermincola potens]|uniref:Deoxyribose-phosphate aldolase n=1 Tax=Thermincola potens (strain JR) TaxID=635013 RepID=D5XC53_THEPJ|nr:deoxyribose-phosphate aldolase [Thermincola potens]ADG83505.1 deoxyribose-phosphate aldolase [Thermincola potens JR]
MQIDLAKMIDHTILKPNITDDRVRQVCDEAKKFGFASVCVNPCYLPMVSELLRGSEIKACTVIGFPLGANTTETKIYEAEKAVGLGANELDYVLNISDVLNGRYTSVREEMERFVELRSKHEGQIVIKVILETCYLTNEQIIRVCQLARLTGLDFVKTSTGFGAGGATVEHVRLMREIVGPELGVKASGGIKTYEDAAAMVKAGANRIGASNSVAIVSKT